MKVCVFQAQKRIGDDSHINSQDFYLLQKSSDLPKLSAEYAAQYGSWAFIGERDFDKVITELNATSFMSRDNMFSSIEKDDSVIISRGAITIRWGNFPET
jgi:hypothetical protein